MLKQILLASEKRGRRDRLFIISALLSQAGRGTCKTQLMYKVGLSFSQVEIYLHVLLRSELLEVSNCGRSSLYKTTDEGRNFLCAFDTLLGLLDQARNGLLDTESERFLFGTDDK